MINNPTEDIFSDSSKTFHSTNQLKIIRISEKAIEKEKVFTSDEVFSSLKKRLDNIVS